MYYNCCVCGMLSDDGSFIEYSGKCFHVCMDCFDTLTKENILAFIDKQINDNDKQPHKGIVSPYKGGRMGKVIAKR